MRLPQVVLTCSTFLTLFLNSSWEQIGEWNQAQVLYESAQITARTGVLPFTESELALWEDHWIVSAQKLQQVRYTSSYSLSGLSAKSLLVSLTVGRSIRVRHPFHSSSSPSRPDSR